MAYPTYGGQGQGQGQDQDQGYAYPMTQSYSNNPIYTPLLSQSPYSPDIQSNFSDGPAQYAAPRPASYHGGGSIMQLNSHNGSAINLASGTASNNGNTIGDNHPQRHSMYKMPLSSPGGMSHTSSDPLSPSSVVPLLGYSPTQGIGGNGNGNGTGAPYSPPPPFNHSISSPSLQKTYTGLSGSGGGMFPSRINSASNNNNHNHNNHNNLFSNPTSNAPITTTAKGKSNKANKMNNSGNSPPSSSGKMAQRRFSSFKHTDYDYLNDPIIRKAYLTPLEHFISIWLPFTGFIIILGGMWGLTIATQARPDHMIEVNSQGFYNFGVNQPTLLVAAYTFISSILNSILLWCFTCAVLSYARYRLSLGRPISLRGLSALSSAKDGAFAFHPLGSKWMWLCLICWGTFLATTTGFNTILLPTRRTIKQGITATELDMTSPSFASFYNTNTGTGGSYYDCSRWTAIRGLMVSPCPAGTAFTATTYAARSHFESKELGELTYIRLGAITYTGTTWGTLPFTSFNKDDSNVFSSARFLPRLPVGRQNYSIAIDNQGLRAHIACADVSTSPLSMAENMTTSPIPCNPDTPLNTISPDLRMRAGYCNSTTTPSGGGVISGPSFDFYMRFAGDYIHVGSDGTKHNENITCTITPFVSRERADFRSGDNSTWVTQVAELRPDQGLYPQALVERILSNLVDMMTIFGQNSIDNLIAEQFVQITTAYYDGDYAKWPLVAQRQLEGMFAFLASYERIIAESATATTPTIERLTTNGTLSHDTFAYAVEYPTYLLLIPITIACLLGMWFLIKSASFRHVPRFDPLNTTSLIAASSATSHSLFLDEAAVKGAAPDDDSANDAHVAFVRDDQTGQWGLERVPS